MAETQQKNYRFTEHTLNLIDQLSRSYGGIPRSDVLRIAIEELARRRLFPRQETPKKPQQS